MERFFVICFAVTVFFIVSCGDEDREFVAYDDNNTTHDEENSDNEIQDMVADDFQDDVVNDEIIDEVNDEISDINTDENNDEVTDLEPDNDQDEVNDEDNSDCIGLGGTTGAYPDAPECCEGLQKSTIFEIDYQNKVGYCQGLVGGVVCIKCGNNICDLGEDLCNCSKDCKENRNENCDNSSAAACYMMEPDDCEGSDILAIKDSCWSCVDPLSCQETDRPAHCDDGTVPMCNMMAPKCGLGEVLAYVDSCYECLDKETCN